VAFKTREFSISNAWEGRRAEALKEQRNLLRAIKGRDGDSAEQLARAYRCKTLDLR
jgi:DNA-binding FadR family transcriptional regulator